MFGVSICSVFLYFISAECAVRKSCFIVLLLSSYHPLHRIWSIKIAHNIPELADPMNSAMFQTFLRSLHDSEI